MVLLPLMFRVYMHIFIFHVQSHEYRDRHKHTSNYAEEGVCFLLDNNNLD
jgi:hypothetical protein